VDGLTTASARLAGCVIEVGNGDGADADCRAVEADGGGDGGLLGAGGEAIGGIFYIAAGDDAAVVEEDGGAYAKVAVGSVSVVRNGDRLLLKVSDLRWREVAGMFFGRHEFEAIGCVEG